MACKIFRTTIGWAELVMRLIALVVTLLTLIPAAVGVAQLQSNQSRYYYPYYSDSYYYSSYYYYSRDEPALGASCFMLAWSIIALVEELIFLIPRMIVFGAGGTRIKIIAGVEVAFTVVLSLGYFAGMIVGFLFFSFARFSATSAIFAAAFFSLLAWLLVMVAAIYSTYNVCCGPHKKENTPLTADERHDNEMTSF